MVDYGLRETKTLYNWMMSGVITDVQFKKLVDDGKVAKGQQRKGLIKYSQLKTWNVV